MTISFAADATQAMDDLVQRLEQFMGRWDRDPEPPLAEYLPVAPPAHRRLVLIELIKVDLEQRITSDRPKPLESYTS